MSGDARAIPIQNALTVNHTGKAQFTIDFHRVVSTEIVPATGAVTYGAFAFALTDVTNYTNWTINFDRYRINSVTMVFTPSRLQMNTGSVTVAPQPTPTFVCGCDFDDGSTPTSIASVERLSRSVTTPFTTAFRRHFVPRVVREVYRGVATTGYEPAATAVWIDAAYPDVPHYGLKWAADTQGLANQFAYEVQCVYNVSFAFPRA